MGLLDNKSTPEYYQGNDHGNYQFTSLEAIIAQFEVAYVGENKIIRKINKSDIAFHAMRALQELSFDTFKSIKSQQIDLPPSLTMILPQDYVNYTKLSTVDSAGIKHPLYPTTHTSNPFQILQNTDGTYTFGETTNVVLDGDFAASIDDNWLYSQDTNNQSWSGVRTTTPNPTFDANGVQLTTGEELTKQYFIFNTDTVRVESGTLRFKHGWKTSRGVGSKSLAAWQQVDVSDLDTVNLVATAQSGATITSGSTLLCGFGVIRVGVTTTNPMVGWVQPSGNVTNAMQHTNGGTSGDPLYPGPNENPNNYDLGYIEWSDGTLAEKELRGIDVTSVNTAWVYIQSFSPWTIDAVTTLTQGAQGVSVWDGAALDIAGLGIQPTEAVNQQQQQNYIDNIVLGTTQTPKLSQVNTDKNSSTWNSYKSHTPSENNTNDYQDYQNDIYWPNEGSRFGLDPKHAQVNGSFYIDNRLGKINFSSNISGKTVILDYISDSLGTDAEMQVHKFAEDAMYKWIAHAILSTSSYGQGLVRRLTKDKFAAVRKAKLRLSNINLEELTQILRGKSKHIKH